MIAGPSSTIESSPCRRTFSAKFSVASGKNRAPGMRFMSTAIRLPFDPTIRPKFHIASQKSSGFVTLQS